MPTCSPPQVLPGLSHHHDLVLTSGCKKWDTCAPEAILHAMGGRLTDIHGADYQYHAEVQHQNMEGVLATARSEDHALYVAELPQSLKEQVKHSLKKKK